jgi:hypothetical protein
MRKPPVLSGSTRKRSCGGSDPNAFAAALKDEKGIEVRLRNWY